MFGRLVKIHGRELFVSCSPHTPLSEVLARAARQMEVIERWERENDPNYQAYRRAVTSGQR